MCMCVHVTYVHVSKYFFMCTFVDTCYREEKHPKPQVYKKAVYNFFIPRLERLVFFLSLNFKP